MQGAEDVIVPSQVQHVFVEVMQYIFRCKLAILAAVRHSFCGILTLEIAKVLTPAAPKQSRLKFSTLARTFTAMPSSSASTPAPQTSTDGGASDSLPMVSPSAMASVPEASQLVPESSDSPKINMDRNPMMNASTGGPKDTESSEKIRQASKEGLLDSTALGGLLEIIDGEFQVQILSWLSQYMDVANKLGYLLIVQCMDHEYLTSVYDLFLNNLLMELKEAPIMQVMKECLVPQIFDEVLMALWRATCEVLEGFLLASLPSQAPLTPPQVGVPCLCSSYLFSTCIDLQ